MSYFPCDIPFMSEEELKENGIIIPKTKTGEARIDSRMTAEEAKEIILNDPDGDILKRMEAIAVAREILGEDCTMKEIWRWAEGG